MTPRTVGMAAAAAMGVAWAIVPADVVPVRAQPASRQAAATNDLRVLPVRGNIYLLSGAGANITV